jgi:hypothetical protein
MITHSKQEVSGNTFKKVSTIAQKGVSTTAQENIFQEDHEGSSWENREKLD